MDSNIDQRNDFSQLWTKECRTTFGGKITSAIEMVCLARFSVMKAATPYITSAAFELSCARGKSGLGSVTCVLDKTNQQSCRVLRVFEVRTNDGKMLAQC